MAEVERADNGERGARARPSGGEVVSDYLAPLVGFVIGAVLILLCAFTLPRLPAAVEVIGPWTVWGGFTVVTIVAGVLFWANLRKLYTVLTQ